MAKDSVLFIAGSRGSGKSTFLAHYARGFSRIIVWDPMREYGEALDDATCADSPAELVAALGHRIVVYRPHMATMRAFDHFCHCAYVRGGPSLVVVDELAAVTTPAKASGWWGMIVRQGRHQRLTVAAATQRPQEIDKTIVGNATRIVCFRLKRAGDRKYMAAEIGLDGDIGGMSLRQFEFIDADEIAGTLKRARLVFRR